MKDPHAPPAVIWLGFSLTVRNMEPNMAPDSLNLSAGLVILLTLIEY